MTTIVSFKPCSRQGRWLCALTIRPSVLRLQQVVKHLTRLNFQAEKGDLRLVLQLSQAYQQIKQLETHYHKTTQSLFKLLQRRTQSSLQFEPTAGTVFRFNIATPLAAHFYQLIIQFDTLMSALEACHTFSIFKKSRTLPVKQQYYSKLLLRFMAKMSEKKLTADKFSAPLTSTEQRALEHALQSGAIDKLLSNNELRFAIMHSFREKQENLHHG